MFVFEDTQCMAFLLLFSRSVMSDSLRPHGLQHTRLPCPSLSPRVCSNSFSLNCWCYTTILSSAAPSLFALNLFQHQGLFQQVSSSHQVAKVLELQLQHQSFNEYSGLISLLLTGLIPYCSRAPEKSSPVPQSKNINSLALNLLYGTTLTSIHDYWKNHSLD